MPAYETISYCWGTSSLQEQIHTDDKVLNVAATTVAALRRMRPAKEHRMLWIDAVCIDQGNVDERNHQVPLMCEIYTHSQGNLIHLEGGRKVKEAMETVKTILLEKPLLPEDQSSLWKRKRQGIKSSCTWLDLVINFEALNELLVQAVCGRLWVLQEIALAPKNTIFYGNSSMDLNPLTTAMSWLGSQNIDLHGLHEGALRVLTIGWVAYPEHNPLKSLRILLGLTLPLESTLPHDRLYALIGLYRRANGLSHVPELLKADYLRPPGSVFRDATRQAILQDGTLHILRDKKPKSPTSGYSLPSWVPGWFDTFVVRSDLVSLSEAYHASGESVIREEDLAHYHDPNCISLAGIRIGLVTQVSVKLTKDIYLNAAWMLDWLTAVEEQAIRATAVTDVTHSHNLGMTLIGGIRGVRGIGHSANTEDALQIDAFRYYLQDRTRLPSEGSGPSDTVQQQALCFQESIGTAMLNRSFFTTSSGRIGIGPSEMQPNDQLIILQGGPWPFLLRPLSNDYQLVGPCYVYRIMFGEAWKGEESADIQLFNIR